MAGQGFLLTEKLDSHNMNLLMRLFRHRNGIWYAEISRQKRVSLKTRDRAQAQALYRKLKKAVLDGRLAALQGRLPDKNLADFAEEYLEFSRKTQARSTWQNNRTALGHLLTVLGARARLAQIDRRTLEIFLADLPVSIISRNTYLRHLKAAFARAVAWGYLRSNPGQGLKQIKDHRHLPRYLEREDIQRLLAAETDPRYARLWRFLVLTGCRRSEALQLQARDIDWPRQVIHVRRTKARREKLLPITSALAELLRDLPQVGRHWPWQPDAASHRFAKIARRAGLAHVRLHDLRHTFASHLAMAGVALQTIQALLGHEDIKATQIYAHLSESHLREAAGKLKI